MGGSEGFAVLAAVTRTLASAEDRHLDVALALLADGLSVPATLTLREAGRSRTGAVLATSGLTLVPPQPRASTALLEIPLKLAGRLAAALVVVADAPLDGTDLHLLGAAADALTLALAAVLPDPDAGRQVLDLEEELDELRRVETTLSGRSLAGDLAVSVRAAVAASRRTGTEVRLELPAQVMPTSPVLAVTAYHVVLAALAGVRTEALVAVSAPGGPHRQPFSEDRADELVVTVTGAKEPHDTGTLARWARRAASLDGRLDRHLDGVTLVLPWSPARTYRPGTSVAPVRPLTASTVLTGATR